MATIDTVRQMEPDTHAPIGWDGKTLKAMLETSDELFATTGYYHGLERLQLKESDPLHFEKLFSRVRGNLSVSPAGKALRPHAEQLPSARHCGHLYTRVRRR